MDIPWPIFFETGHVLRHYVFSVLPTENLVYPIATSLIYAALFNLSGLTGVVLFHRLVLLLISAMWYKCALSKLNSPWSLSSGLVILLAWLGSSIVCIDRPALLAMLPFVFSYLVLQKEDDLSGLDVIKLNAVNILWVNLHGSWLILGLMYSWRELFRYFVQKKPFHPFKILGPITIGISSLINPFGYKVFPYVIETARISQERGIAEWAVTSFSGDFTFQAIYYYLLVFVTGGFYLYLRKVDWTKSLAVLASPFTLLLLFGFQSIPNTLWPFFVLIPFACQFGLISGGKRVDRFPNKGQSVLNLVFVGGLVFLTVLLTPNLKTKIADLLPPSKRAVFADILNETIDRDPVFNDWDYGSFLSLYQSHPIFIDVRNIIYSKNSFEEYLTVVEAKPDWENVLKKYRVRYILLNKKLRQKLIGYINSSEKWQHLKENESTVLFKLADQH